MSENNMLPIAMRTTQAVIKLSVVTSLTLAQNEM